MSIPQSPKARKIVLKRVEESVQLLREIDGIKEDLKAIVEANKEQYGMRPAEFNKLVKTAYDRNKVETLIEELQTSVSEFEILTGK